MITEISYQRKIGRENYGSEQFSVTCTVAKSDVDPIEVAEDLKLLVEAQLYGQEWRRNYELAMRVITGEQPVDDDTEREAQECVTNYEAWNERVTLAKLRLGKI